MEDIYWIRSDGVAQESDMYLREELIERVIASRSGVCRALLLDFGGLQKASLGARRVYMRWMARTIDTVEHVVAFGMSRRVRALVYLGRAVDRRFSRIRFASTLAQALERIGASHTSPPQGGVSDESMEPRMQQVLHHLAKLTLQEDLNQTIPTLPPEDPYAPLFETLGAVQEDIRELVEFRAQSARRLDAQVAVVSTELEHALARLGTEEHRRMRAEARLQELTRRLRDRESPTPSEPSERMEAVRRLAGGIAQDFNSLLTLILGYSSQARERVGRNPRAAADLDEVLGAARRASELTKQLMAFSRMGDFVHELLDVNDVVRGAREMLDQLTGPDIECLFEITGQPLHIQASGVQLEQALVHLVANARDAMASGGRITISTQHDAEVRMALVSVSDEGGGMSERVRAHAFEPFFSTKGTGKGLGMGLAIVYGIVRRCGGTIEVQSVEGQGTCIEMALPLVPVDMVRDEWTDPDSDTPSSARGTVFYVEDDDLVRSLYERVLRDAGFRVRTFSRGPEFVDEVQRIAVDQDQPLPDVVLLDVVMPGWSGPRVAQRVRPFAPDAAVIFVSGHRRSAVRDVDVAGERTAYLRKPFAPGDLVRTITDLLKS